MLDAGIEVMIYAGVEDLICNWLGNYRWVNALPWNGAKAWAASDLRPWLVDGSVAGEVRQAQGLTFVKVHGAGHMVPMVGHPASPVPHAFPTHVTRHAFPVPPNPPFPLLMHLIP